jgi:hypothetical protein
MEEKIEFWNPIKKRQEIYSLLEKFIDDPTFDNLSEYIYKIDAKGASINGELIVLVSNDELDKIKTYLNDNSGTKIYKEINSNIKGCNNIFTIYYIGYNINFVHYNNNFNK